MTEDALTSQKIATTGLSERCAKCGHPWGTARREQSERREVIPLTPVGFRVEGDNAVCENCGNATPLSK